MFVKDKIRADESSCEDAGQNPCGWRVARSWKDGKDGNEGKHRRASPDRSSPSMPAFLTQGP